MESARKVIESGCDEYLLKHVQDLGRISLVIERSIERRRLLEHSILQKRIGMGKSKIIHDVCEELVEPVHELLNTADMFINSFTGKEQAETRALAENIKKNVDEIASTVGKLAESSERLKAVEDEE